ncbi:putative E3 ubiquitin-protein ligase LIN-1 [Elaeis guineensis]|uniref:RING-type E3 ubiquitin transferase n=1 Tax=Elaeis guineensis var. tenera TaxID=51953 RepID=A0A6I9QX26_ELAGV|nr:putative E3 ubiquitin-protein ligase LIN-1 [Elaeis guineensis]XP_019704454.1 putative E3 ubiquitin-protein ligase LIN-1 [Elaeis guineensis]
MTAATPGSVLRPITAFLDEALSQPDLHHRILSAALGRPPFPDPAALQALSLLSQALDSSAATSPARSSPSALRAAEKLLLSLPSRSPLSVLLLSLTHALHRRPAAAALVLLDLFALDPALSREDVAPSVFEDLFLPHLLPVLHWFADQRARILSTDSPSPAPAAAAVEDDGWSVESSAAVSLLSRMSGGQAAELKKLERGYEDVLDANSRVYAEYLKEVLESADEAWQARGPPQLILGRFDGEGGEIEEGGEEEEESEEAIGLRSGQRRYNPLWADADQSIDFSSRHGGKSQNKFAKLPSLYPQRVPIHLLIRQPSSDGRDGAANLISDSGPAFSCNDNSEDFSSEIDTDLKEKNIVQALLHRNKIQHQSLEEASAPYTCSQSPPMDDSDSILAPGKQTPPKDFICPITSHIFDDPVTLETGQTYERRAIQEWLDRGKSTCPITRQKLHSTQLPKTNYVLKRLIASWQEQNPYSTPIRMENPPSKNVQELNTLSHLPSPTSVITQASTDGITADLRIAISHLCTSEILGESEMAVLQIERFWRESRMEPEILAALSKPAVINGFVEILFNSVNPQVLRVTVFLLSELASKDKSVVQTLTRVDSDVECMVALFKKGLVEAVVLIYLLTPPWQSLIEMDTLEALMMTIKRDEEDLLGMCVKPRTASIFILGQILRREDHKSAPTIVGMLISERVVERVIPSLEADLVEEQITVAGILLRCMKEDGYCRNIIADKAQLAPLLESFAMVSDVDQFEIIQFLSELVKLNRRRFNEQLLHIIKNEGVFSTMHTLLVYLQSALQDQSPVVAGLLLQLDLLVEPRKVSVYCEEAIDALISCLRNPDFPSAQLLAAETILSLQGSFSSSGKPLARAIVLKYAGMNKSYRALMRAEQSTSVPEDSEDNLEEEKAANDWERKMAYALASHEFGLLFEALADGLKSGNTGIFSACLVSAAWLTHMLSLLPDTGIRGAARVCLLKQFVSILKSARHTDDKALAMLALRSFMHDPEGLHDLTLHIKDILKALRELKKSTLLAHEMRKLLSGGQDSSIDIWNHKELVQVDCSTHGEVLAVICFKNKIFSGHSDGTIKVWEGNENLLHPVHETREHSKAVTSLAVSNSGEKLYSGSLDKTVRVWSVQDRQIHCVEIHDMKDPVHNLTVANTIACFIPHGAGVKVLSWNGGYKLLNPSKHVRCLALVQGKLYCGCHDGSIQEIDLATGTFGTIQSGNRKLLGKANPVHAVQVHDGLLYAASTSLDGAAVKIWSASNYSLVGSISPTVEVRSMAISTELIYLGSKTGVVEIWSKNKLIRVGTLQTGTNSKVQCMAVDADAELLIVATSDGNIQAWGLT